MKIQAVKNLVTSKIARQSLKLAKHSPVILFSAGVVGVIGTVVLASRATLKLEEVLTEAQSDLEKISTVEHKDYNDEDRQRDRFIVYARTAGRITRMYAPAVIVGGASIAALTGSHVILSRRNLAVTAAYAALDRGFREYRARVVKELGPDKDREFRYAMEDRRVVIETENGPEVTTIKQPGPKANSIYARFFDETNQNWSKTARHNQFFIQCQQNYANDLLRSRGHIFLNEVYDLLGMDRTSAGAIVGWVYDCCEEPAGDNYVDFGVFEGDRHSGMRFVLGHEDSILLDFNVDGVIWDKI